MGLSITASNALHLFGKCSWARCLPVLLLLVCGGDEAPVDVWSYEHCAVPVLSTTRVRLAHGTHIRRDTICHDIDSRVLCC